MSEDKNYQLIENYLSGVLEKQELLSFEKELLINHSLAKKVRLHQLANELVIENRLLTVKNYLLEEKHKGNPGTNFTKIILSTAIIITSTFSFFIWKNKKNDAISFSTKTTASTIDKVSDASNQPMIIENKTTTRQKNRGHKNNIEIIALVSETQTSLDNNQSNTEPIEREEKSTPLQELLIQKNDPKKYIENSCATVQLKAVVSTLESCKEESNGSILISEYSGGTPPYTASIKNKQEEDVSSLNIPSGIYTVFLRDKMGCSNTIYNVHVAEKICEKEYTFNPFMNELLILPSQDQYGTLTIYEQSGNTYFIKETSPSEIIQWDGYSKNGELNAGYYIFGLVLKNGRTLKGGITIVR